MGEIPCFLFGIETPLKVLIVYSGGFMGRPSDRNKKYMKSMWGTTKLITDYGSLNTNKKKNKIKHQNDIHSKIRNDDDYDDWEYGTEPLYFQ